MDEEATDKVVRTPQIYLSPARKFRKNAAQKAPTNASGIPNCPQHELNPQPPNVQPKITPRFFFLTRQSASPTCNNKIQPFAPSHANFFLAI